MKFAVIALLAGTTSAATALTTATVCHDAAVNTAYTAGIETATKAKALADAALGCTTSLALADAAAKGFKIEDALYAPCKVKVAAITGIVAADTTAFLVGADAFGSALGMGKLSCASGATCTSPARIALKGTLAVQQLARVAAADYYVAQKAHCDATAATKVACNTAGLTALGAMGTAMGAADFYSTKTPAERTTYMTTTDAANVAAAIAATKPALLATGSSCKADTATPPVRPACPATDCCLGVKAAAEDLVNSFEVCTEKTLLAATV